jgi:hypothetical protein
LTWSSDPNATSYDVFRSSQNAPFDPNTPVKNTTALTWDDTGLTLEKGYAYKIRPKYGSAPGTYSNIDYATTVSFTASTAVLATQIAELRRAANEIARAMNLTDPFTSDRTTANSVKYDANGNPRAINAFDLNEIMSAVNGIRDNAAYGHLPAKTFGIPPAASGKVLNSQLTDLRDAVK